MTCEQGFKGMRVIFVSLSLFIVNITGAVGRPLDATYVTGFNAVDTTFLAQPRVCWTGVSGSVAPIEQRADLCFVLDGKGANETGPLSSPSSSFTPPSSRPTCTTTTPQHTVDLTCNARVTDTAPCGATPTSKSDEKCTGIVCGSHDDDESEDAGVTQHGAGRVVVHGIAGYFTSVLHPGIVIDTCHTSRGFNSHHWEAFYFPLPEPVRDHSHTHTHTHTHTLNTQHTTHTHKLENLICCPLSKMMYQNLLWP